MAEASRQTDGAPADAGIRGPVETAPSAEVEGTRERRDRRWLVVGLGAIAVAGSVIGIRWTDDDGASRPARTQAGVLSGGTGAASTEEAPLLDEAALAERDAAYRRAILGSWQRDDYYGRVVLTLREGGAGTMEITFNTVYSYLVADRVVADLEWTVASGRALFRTLRGRPEAAYNTITQNRGQERDRRIVDLNERHMVLQDDLEDDSIAEWTRVE